MTQERRSVHGHWSSRWAFIMAAAGSAVGLGNIWKFPYMTGVNGGGAFVFFYLLCIALIGLPIMIAEVLIGRRARRSPVGAMATLAEEAGRSRWWMLVGLLGVLAGILILSYYSVIAGWTLAYIFRTGSGMFTGATADGVGAIFNDLVGSAESMLAWHTVFMVTTVLVVAQGVKSGLERAVRSLLPALLVLLLVLVGYAMNTEGFDEAVRFLFVPKLEEIGASQVLSAMGHAFFTLSLGMGAIMAYGAYLPHKTSIASTTVTVALADTAVALLAGLAIFPLVFSVELEPGSGPGLIFLTLPIAFGQMPGGAFFGALFFLLLAFAAWTSAISLVEPGIAWLVEQFGLRRGVASVLLGCVTWLLGVASIFSFNIWSEFKLFGKLGILDSMDFLTTNIMLPLGGLLIIVFAAWVLPRTASADELGGEGWFHSAWSVVSRYVTPLAVVVVFLSVLGVFQALKWVGGN